LDNGERIVSVTEEVRSAAVGSITDGITAVSDIFALARRKAPSPEEEAKLGMIIAETSLWNAIPQYYEQLNQIWQNLCKQTLPLDLNTIRFASWMGSDRDGNPFVTASVTKKVYWQAVCLY